MQLPELAGIAPTVSALTPLPGCQSRLITSIDNEINCPAFMPTYRYSSPQPAFCRRTTSLVLWRINSGLVHRDTITTERPGGLHRYSTVGSPMSSVWHGLGKTAASPYYTRPCSQLSPLTGRIFDMLTICNDLAASSRAPPRDNHSSR